MSDNSSKKYLVVSVVNGFIHSLACILLSFLIDFLAPSTNFVFLFTYSAILLLVSVIGGHYFHKVYKQLSYFKIIISFIISIITFVITLLPNIILIAYFVSKFSYIENEDYGFGIIAIITVNFYFLGLIVALLINIVSKVIRARRD